MQPSPTDKTIRSTASEVNKSCDIITKRFSGRSYPKNLVNEQVDKVKNMKRNQLLLASNKKQYRIAFQYR